MKKILLPLVTIGTIIAPIVTVSACGSSSTPSIKDDQPKAKTQQEINEENIKALDEAKQHLANINVSRLNTINLKPSLFLVADIDGKDVLKQYLQVGAVDLKLFDEMQIDVAVSNIDDTNGNLTVTITLTKGDKEPQTMSVSKDLTNFLNHSSYEKYLDQKFFNDMQKMIFNDESIHIALTPIKTTWHHSTSWWQSSYHKEFGFDPTDANWLLQNLILNKNLNVNGKANLKDALFKYVGAKTLPPELDRDDVRVLSIIFDGNSLGHGNDNRTQGFEENIMIGWTNGHVVLKLKIQKGEIQREVYLYIIGWIAAHHTDPNI